MESILSPPSSFCFDQNLLSITSGSLSESWNKWSNGFMIYYNACELSKKTPVIQINILLHVVGEQCRDLYEQFSTKHTTVADVLKEFQGYFEQKKNITVERHRFFMRNQNENETIEQYVFDLKKLSGSCEFGNLADSLIKDRLICGITSSTIRERLLREADLTLTRAMEICRAAVVSKIYSNRMRQDEKRMYEIWQDHEETDGHNTARASGQRSGNGRGGRGVMRGGHSRPAGYYGGPRGWVTLPAAPAPAHGY